MSQQNVDIAKRAMDAFNRRDVGAFTKTMTWDIEWFPALERGLSGGGYRGYEGVASYFANLGDTWRQLSFRAEEYRDLDEQVLALGRMQGLGSSSGVSVDAPMGIVFDFRGAEVFRARSFLDHAQALEAVGLQE